MKKCGAVCLVLICFLVKSQAQDVRINEVLSSNSDLLDEDGDSPDWIELYNASDQEVSLEGWRLKDQSGGDGWIFPNVMIDPDKYLLVWASGKNKSSLSYPRTLINQGDQFRFSTPSQTLPNSWIDLGYNDSSWGMGASGFGYGDNDDETRINQGRISVFFRKKFTISDVSLVEQLILDIDYDDAYIAYINGVEISRDNIQGVRPGPNVTSITDKEAQMYQGGKPARSIVPNIEELLFDGENILAIQLHNISSSSSDMTLIPFLTAVYNTPTNEGVVPPDLLGYSNSNLHTDFKLSSDEEYLELTDQEGAIVDSISIPQGCPNVSYGISTAGDNVYFATPTPNRRNEGETFVALNPNTVVFSNDGGLVDPFTLVLSGNTLGGDIRFTRDGSVPTTLSQQYTSPLVINANSVITASIFRENYLPSKPVTRTFITEGQHDLPLVTLTADPVDLFDEDVGMYAFGDDYNGNFPYMGANFWQDWERPMAFSFYDTDQNLLFNSQGGAKIFGNYSRANGQRSFSLFARGEYGDKDFDYPLFEERKYDEYQSFVLRNAGNDWIRSMFRDGLITGLADDYLLDQQAFKPYVSYLNGEYWGIYNLREKVSNHFIASRHDIDAEEVDLLEFNGDVVDGENQEYIDLINFITSQSLTQDAAYDFVTNEIDIDNFIYYQVLQIFSDNRDWPGNNIKYWKSKEGKWRWILFDTDFGFAIWNAADYNFNTLDFALSPNGPNWPNPPWSTLLLRRLIGNTSFRHKFINRFADELNTRLSSRNVDARITELSNQIRSEIPNHQNQWNQSAQNWNGVVQQMKTFAARRPSFVKNDLLDRFNISSFHQLKISNANTNQGYVLINDRVAAKGSNWLGDYFNGVPILITAVANPGFTFSHWEGDISEEESELEIALESSTDIRPIFIEDLQTDDHLIINEINYNSAKDHDTKDWVELHNKSNTAIDISKWSLEDIDGNRVEFWPGTVIKADGYLVISQHREYFTVHHRKLDNYTWQLDFGLSKNGDVVSLYNRNEELVNQVSYLPNAAWSERADGQGWTLELLDPALDNTIPENWESIHQFGSPGRANDVISSNIEISSEVNLYAFPNPHADDFKVKIVSPFVGRMNLRLTDVSGRLLIEQSDVKLEQGENNYTFNTVSIPPGIYLLSAKNENFIETLQIIKAQ